MASQNFGRLTPGFSQTGKHSRVNRSTDSYSFSVRDFFDGSTTVSLRLTNRRAGRDADVALYRDWNGNGKLDFGEFVPVAKGSPSLGSQETIFQSLSDGNYIAQVSRNSSVSGEARYTLTAQAFSF